MEFNNKDITKGYQEIPREDYMWNLPSGKDDLSISLFTFSFPYREGPFILNGPFFICLCLLSYRLWLCYKPCLYMIYY